MPMISRSARRGLVVLGLVLSLCGCGGAKLSELDREFVSLYQTKIDYRTASDGLLLPPDALSQAFADLSQRAAAGARAAPAASPALQVAFWRVATLAAWQAGEAGETAVIDQAEAGRRACDALRSAGQDAPRDCLLLETAEPLARQDATLREMRALVGRLGAGPTYPPAERQKFESFFGDFIGRLQDLGALRRREFGRAAVPDTFWPRFDRQMTIVACNANKARGYAGQAGASMSDLTGLFVQLEAAAKATGIREPSILYSAASCLDLSDAFSALDPGAAGRRHEIDGAGRGHAHGLKDVEVTNLAPRLSGWKLCQSKTA